MKATSSRNGACHVGGFTLIELLIVMVVIAILAAVAIPGYRNQVTKTNRGAAKACMAQYAQHMERFYTTSMSYTGGAPASALACAMEGGLNTRYTIAVDNVTATTYRVTSTPTSGAWATRDSRCGTLTLNQAGARTAAGSAAAADLAQCW
jgi:type IV pilus assembly protein PilE